MTARSTDQHLTTELFGLLKKKDANSSHSPIRIVGPSINSTIQLFSNESQHFLPFINRGWSGVAKVLVPGRPTIWMIVGQGPIALAVGAGGGCLDIFTLRYLFSSFSLSLGGGPTKTEILSQRAVKPQPTN